MKQFFFIIEGWFCKNEGQLADEQMCKLADEQISKCVN